MIKHLLSVLMLLISFSVNAQEEKPSLLDSITTLERAKDFIKEQNNKENKVVIFNEEKHKSILAKSVLQLKKGGSKIVDSELEKIHYKVIEKNKIEYSRVSYIFLDGEKMSNSAIEELRELILKKYNNGTPFKDLARKYSMDNNSTRGGDLGWFTYGDMLPKFEQQVLNEEHNVGEVFLVDIESKQWHYVIQKTFDKKSITEMKVLKVVENKR